MADIRAGQIVAFYLFDVAETIDLQTLPKLIGAPAVAARLAPKPATPPYIQYDKPPLSFDGAAVDMAELDGFQVRCRAYDYGVISIALYRSFKGDWAELLAIGQSLIENADLEQRAEGLCRRLIDRLQPALVGGQRNLLAEDYLVYVIHELENPFSADDLVVSRGEVLATMLRGERQVLSDQEVNKILRHRISYLTNDLVIPTWNAALVYDTPAGADAALEILEFANTQLLEFRYYDDLLDNELGSIYARLQHPKWYDEWIGSRYTREARHVHSLFIDVNDLTDRTENALKFIGDIYAARLFTLVADRFGLDTWKANVREKLKTLDDVYRFAVEQSSISRGQFLELTIVLILILELALVFMGVMK
ncbi:MAG TPA: hypothetical protein VNZ26_14970 [Vicinamibacterales bacterium]|nr:hypothetical protein [Vicinamibacterales bacterium]